MTQATKASGGKGAKARRANGSGALTKAGAEADLDRVLELAASGLKPREVARQTGYQEASVRTLLWRHREKVHKLALARLGEGLPARLEELDAICRNPKTPINSRVQAIALWLKVAGAEPAAKFELRVDRIRGLDDAELLDGILEGVSGDPDRAIALLEAVNGGTVPDSMRHAIYQRAAQTAVSLN